MMNSVRASSRKNKDNLIMKFNFVFEHLHFAFSAGASIFLMDVGCGVHNCYGLLSV